MKRRILSSILILVLLAFTGLAQTQQGLVKIKGRYSPSGKVIPGPPLAGVSVKVKGRNAVLSNKNGTFQFPVPSAKFYLDRVSFLGHRIADPDKLRTQYSYSKENPLEIAMEDIEQHAKDVEYAVNNMRREMLREIRKREDEIYRLREENKIQEKEFQKQLQKLHADTEKGEKLVMEMAEYFASIDFDRIDDQKREISTLILKGELQKAKAMILRPGRDIDKEIDNIHLKEEFDNKNVKQKEAELAEAKTEAEKTIKQKSNLADDLYSLHQVYALEFKNDSAAYCLERRAQLDTLNIKWQLEYAKYVWEYSASSDKALKILQHALTNGENLYSNIHPVIATIYNNIGTIYFETNNQQKAYEYFDKSIQILIQCVGLKHPLIAEHFNNMGMFYAENNHHDQALEYYNKALVVINSIEADNNILSVIFSNIGSVYSARGLYDKSLEYYLKSLKIAEDNRVKNNIQIATIYGNLGNCYSHIGNFEYAFKYLDESLQLRKKVLREDHPDLANSYYNLGSAYATSDQFEKSVINIEQSLNINISHFGERHIRVARDYNNLGKIYVEMGEFVKGMKYLEKSLDIVLNSLGCQHRLSAQNYQDIGMAFERVGNYSAALENYNKSIEIATSVMNVDDQDFILLLQNYGTCYFKKGEYQLANKYYDKCLQLLISKYGEEDQNVINFECSLVQFYANTDNYRKAIETAQIVVGKLRSIHGDSHPDVKKGLDIIYRLYNNIIKRDSSYLVEYKSFLSNIVFVVTLIDSNSSTIKCEAQEYILLQNDNWNINQTSIYLVDILNNSNGRAEELILFDDGKIKKCKNVQLNSVFLKYISPDEKSEINRLYQEWKSKQQ